MKFVLTGAGSRGMTYALWAKQHGMEIAAIAEKRPDRLNSAGDRLGVPEAMRFSDAAPLFAQGKIADAAIIATMDRDHYGHVMQALDCGYDILLEKPISPVPRECIAIEEKANALGRKITVCHVLRYTNFFMQIKEILDSGELGKVVAIKHSENIGSFHMAHSFVRGNWRNDQLSSPIILQKSCHDLDILLWLTGAHCTKVSAFGSLSYFRESNAPAGSSDRCLSCAVADSCRFDARKAYLPVLGQWPADVVCLEQTEEALMEALKTGPYGRCVYRCDNNVCDHMSILMEFDNGVTATFSLTAQTSACHRNIHIMCEDGEILADDGERRIVVTHHVSSQADTFTERVINVRTNGSGHVGGDAGIMEDFTAVLSGEKESRSSISRSVESHLMAFAIEQARLTGNVVDMAEYRKSLT
ncbi:Gfo/Idh/MocA family oxidoreductase [bacterium]|uniref:Gfo/Idh/MocA family protein n=1 Tax=Dysosmobacter sp. TaxID=2591382 RepID=UPI002A8E8538|nr:Gfo/Idh/MocA family oxidoreductase [Dysosmobacter sp.]MCI7807720.1 Gfo/Idh/MocA family oxidoreductase [bacterium]MDY3282651.1 Gfo/Idh/MocA family oxidoreductase [Dysosmobacter sp.]